MINFVAVDLQDGTMFVKYNEYTNHITYLYKNTRYDDIDALLKDFKYLSDKEIEKLYDAIRTFKRVDAVKFLEACKKRQKEMVKE